MLPKTVEAALNAQINAELYSFYLYLSMASWCKSENLPGFSTWLEAQAEEEMMHSMKIYRYMDERGGRVEFSSIDTPPAKWESPLGLLEQVMKHEQSVTQSINLLVKAAREENDVATEIFLQWFVTEQVEEEATVSQVVNDLKRQGDNMQGLYLQDREMGQRTPITSLFDPNQGNA